MLSVSGYAFDAAREIVSAKRLPSDDKWMQYVAGVIQKTIDEASKETSEEVRRLKVENEWLHKHLDEMNAGGAKAFDDFCNRLAGKVVQPDDVLECEWDTHEERQR